MKWATLRTLILSILFTSIILIQLAFEPILTKLFGSFSIVVVAILLFLALILLDVVKNRYRPGIMDILPGILNSCARNKLEITTIDDFLQETKESSLGRGSEVHVLTNSLESYDLTLPALKVIARNLANNVKYIYYLHVGEYPQLADQKDRFVNLLLNERKDLTHDNIDSNLIFHIIDEPALYNFSIVKAQGAKGYWYVTTVPEGSANLAILLLDQDNIDKLMKVFSRLSSYKKVSALRKGFDK